MCSTSGHCCSCGWASESLCRARVRRIQVKGMASSAKAWQRGWGSGVRLPWMYPHKVLRHCCTAATYKAALGAHPCLTTYKAACGRAGGASKMARRPSRTQLDPTRPWHNRSMMPQRPQQAPAQTQHNPPQPEPNMVNNKHCAYSATQAYAWRPSKDTNCLRHTCPAKCGP